MDSVTNSSSSGQHSGARNSFLVSHIGAREPGVTKVTISCCLTRHISRKLNQRQNRHAWINTPVWGAGIISCSSTNCPRTPTPKLELLNNHFYRNYDLINLVKVDFLWSVDILFHLMVVKWLLRALTDLGYYVHVDLKGRGLLDVGSSHIEYIQEADISNETEFVKSGLGGIFMFPTNSMLLKWA